MDSGQLALFHHLELGAGNTAQGALEIGGHLVGFVNITANGADKLLHNISSKNFYSFMI
jgi:hypothetical protein